MGDNSSDDLGMDLNFNQDLREQSRESDSSDGALMNKLESARSRIFERIRLLEAVSERARVRERQARDSVENGPVAIDIMASLENRGGDGSRVDNAGVVEGNEENQIGESSRVDNAGAVEGNEENQMGESSRVDNVGVMERNEHNGKVYNRDSMHLVAKALEMDSKEKKAHKEDGNFYDCNICLKIAREPILTCCGHLFCWACFYEYPRVDSSAKECLVCKGEVLDNNIVPIYGNGNANHTSESRQTSKVPPRPKAQRVESVRQHHITQPQGLFIPPIPDSFLRLRTRIGSVVHHLPETPRREIVDYDSGSRDAQITQTTGSLHQQSHQVSRVSLENSAHLSGRWTVLNLEEDRGDDVETSFSFRLVNQTIVHLPSTDDRDPLTGNAAAVRARPPTLSDLITSSRTNDISHTDVQLENLTTATSPQTNLPDLSSYSFSRRRSERLSDAGRENFRQSWRRRLN